jgi:hypothetical protein
MIKQLPFFVEYKNGVSNYISEDVFKVRSLRYRKNIKKNADEWRRQGFKIVFVSARNRATGIIDIKGFKDQIELDFYLGSGWQTANVVYL